jgi:hypothetical protein
MVVLSPLQDGCFDDEHDGGVTNDPPDPSGTEATLWVEVDWHKRLVDPDDPDQTNSRDLVTYIQEWRSTVLEGGAGSACSHRFSDTDAEMDVRPEKSDEINWSSTKLTAAATAQGFSADVAGAVLLLKSMKTQRTNLPNLYLFAGEHFTEDPSTYTFPYATSQDIYLGFARGHDFEDDPNTQCYFATGIGYPVGVVFVSEIEKLVDEMNEYTNEKCGFYYYDLKKMMRHVVIHELFHELFVSSPYEYTPFYPNTWCHDGDSNCRCVMNVHEHGYVLDLLSGPQHQTPDCATASTITANWQNPCIERVHDNDGCNLADIVSFNPGGN